MIDALVKVLNKAGYMPVKLPKTDIEPPQVYTVDRPRRSIRPWGGLDLFLTPSARKKLKAVPVKRGKAPDIKHTHTTRKKLNLAADFLKDALACIGVSSVPQIDLSFCGNVQLVFMFSGVTSRCIDAGALLPILDGFSVKRIPQDYVSQGGVHIAYEFLYAKKLLMRRADGKAFATNISGKVGEFIDVGTGAEVSVQQETTLSFSGSAKAPVAFAYRSGRVLNDGDDWAFYIHDPMLGARPDVANSRYVPIKGAVPTTETT